MYKRPLYSLEIGGLKYNAVLVCTAAKQLLSNFFA